MKETLAQCANFSEDFFQMFIVEILTSYCWKCIFVSYSDSVQPILTASPFLFAGSCFKLFPFWCIKKDITMIWEKKSDKNSWLIKYVYQVCLGLYFFIFLKYIGKSETMRKSEVFRWQLLLWIDNWLFSFF